MGGVGSGRPDQAITPYFILPLPNPQYLAPLAPFRAQGFPVGSPAASRGLKPWVGFRPPVFEAPPGPFPRWQRAGSAFEAGAPEATANSAAVGIVLDDVLPAVTPCHDMIDGIGILDAQSSCHHPIESSCRVSFNKKF